jgi:hypothetical protein
MFNENVKGETTMAGVNFSKKLTNWDQTAGAVRIKLEEMPEATPLLESLVKLIGEARTLLIEQEDLRGRLRKTVRLRQQMETDGEEMKNRLAAYLQAKLGFKDETLIGFGVPFRTRRRRTATKKKPAADAPPASSTTPPAA